VWAIRLLSGFPLRSGSIAAAQDMVAYFTLNFAVGVKTAFLT
jgi:hypothetical protein